MTRGFSAASINKFNGALALLLVAGVAGCAAPAAPPPQAAAIALNFDYKPAAKAVDTGRAIAFVQPSVASTIGAAPTGTGAAVAVQARAGSVGSWAPRSPQLETALSETILTIVTAKGFRTMGPYAAFDDLTFGDKKVAYLASTPVLRYAIERANPVATCSPARCNETGNFVVTGEMFLKLVEPLSGQAVLNKRINLSDFAISEPYSMNYTVQAQGKGLGGLAEALINASLSGAPKPDNARDAYNKAVNAFFAKATAKIDAFLSREEIISLEKQVLELKGLKRF